LELVSLSEGNSIDLGLYVENSNPPPQLNQSMGSSIGRFREGGVYRSRIIRTDDQANFMRSTRPHVMQASDFILILSPRRSLRAGTSVKAGNMHRP
jgi:hypothetical protein